MTTDNMKQEILEHLDNPAQLERLYRNHKLSFKRAFTNLYPGLKGTAVADIWNERLHYDSDEVAWGSRKELAVVLVIGFISGIIAKVPALFSLNEEFFYPRNIGFIVFPGLIAWFSWKHKLPAGKFAFLAGATIFGLLFINSLPQEKQPDTLLLSCIHMLVFLWSLLGFAFSGNKTNDADQRLSFLKYNGDLAVITALIAIAGGILSGITIGLFSLIGFQIEEFYFQNIALFGAAAAPIMGTFLVRTNPQLVGRISPVIAKIFSPLVLVMLVVYLAAMAYSGKDPYNDREFLVVFNALLIGVLAIIFFSIAERSSKSRAEVIVLCLLSLLTIVVNGIALSAIVFRISEWGFTPNRSAILGSNILVLGNLLLVTMQLFRVVRNKTGIESVGRTIARYLPVYCIWAMFVTFLFPLIFGSR